MLDERQIVSQEQEGGRCCKSAQHTLLVTLSQWTLTSSGQEQSVEKIAEKREDNIYQAEKWDPPAELFIITLLCYFNYRQL